MEKWTDLYKIPQSIENGYYQYFWAESKCVCTNVCSLPRRHWDKRLSPVLASKSLVCLSVLLCFYRNTDLFIEVKLIVSKLLYTKTQGGKSISSYLTLLFHCTVIYFNHTLSLHTSPMGSVIFQLLVFTLLLFSTYSATHHYLPATLILHPVPRFPPTPFDFMYIFFFSRHVSHSVHSYSQLYTFCFSDETGNLWIVWRVFCLLPYLGFPLYLMYQYVVWGRHSVDVCWTNEGRWGEKKSNPQHSLKQFCE